MRRVIGKIVKKLLERNILKATGSLLLNARKDAGSEAAIHAVYEMFNKESTEAVLMVDASNTFNATNWEAFLRNTKKICSSIST